MKIRRNNENKFFKPQTQTTIAPLSQFIIDGASRFPIAALVTGDATDQLRYSSFCKYLP